MKMRRYKITYALVLVLLLAGGSFLRATVLGDGVHPMRGTYSGITPCADCEGIVTTITLDDPGPNAGMQAGTFTMSMGYKGRGVHTKISGKWELVASPDMHDMHGYRVSGFIRLTQVNADGSVNYPQYFYCNKGQTLRMLDGAMHELPDSVVSTLTRVQQRSGYIKPL